MSRAADLFREVADLHHRVFPDQRWRRRRLGIVVRGLVAGPLRASRRARRSARR